MTSFPRRLTVVPVAAAFLALAGCVADENASPSPPETAVEGAAATSPDPPATETEPRPTATVTTASPTATTGEWQLEAIDSNADCELLSSHAIDAPAMTYGEVGMEVELLALQTANHAGVVDRGDGACGTTDHDGNAFVVFIGRTSDGSNIGLDAFASLPGPDPYGDNPVIPYDAEEYGAGFIHFTEGHGAAVCHYAEGSLLISHQRPIDGECRTSLRAIVDAIRS